MHASLVLSLASLQALDVALTLRALSRGATEANPVMSGVVGSPAAFIALKAATTAASIYGVQKIRKRHPRATTVFVMAINSAMFAVVAHNAGLK